MRTVTGLFDDYSTAQDAVSDLEDIGIPSSDISIVSHHSGDETNAGEGAGIGAGVGAAVGGAGGLLAGLGIMAIPGVGPVVAAGWLASTLAGAVGGAVVGGATGGLIGALTESGVSEDDANFYAEGVRRGGTIVTARVADEKYAEADAILKGLDRVDIAARRQQYVDDGWQKFDPNAKPYTDEEIDRERNRYL
ncbi:general stress protein [Microvirga sp. W0021]|uniref:General stress protein n=1 Tax=Hohaiivirga grylli TaxID=3133970 RepID=A0ABV0BHZ6_9HYPH